MIRFPEIKGDALHHLNSVLMVVSLAVAFVIPFELFLFSYGVLGPLHYLTEINWLRGRSFFTPRKNDVWILTLLCVVATWINFSSSAKAFQNISFLLLISFYLAMIFVVTGNWLYRLLLLVPGFILIKKLILLYPFQVFIGLYLPTLIHVLIFTWLFMIYGVLKEPGRAGWLSIFVLALCVALVFLIPAPSLQYSVGKYVKDALGPFELLNAHLVRFLGLGQPDKPQYIYTHLDGFIVMRFIAFAYTYHYLNWFSKTSVIRWHKTEKKNMLIIILLWIVSVGFYALDYKVGMNVLFFLSFLHVFLEFPLNIVSIRGISQMVFSLAIKK